MFSSKQKYVLYENARSAKFRITVYKITEIGIARSNHNHFKYIHL